MKFGMTHKYQVKNITWKNRLYKHLGILDKNSWKQMNKRILLQTLLNRDRRIICQSILPQKTDYQITINKQFANHAKN